MSLHELCRFFDGEVICADLLQTGRILVHVDFRQVKLHHCIDQVICEIYATLAIRFGAVVDAIRLLDLVPNLDQVLQPNVEFPSQVDLTDPEVDHVEVVVEENLCFVRRRNFHVIVAPREVPLGLPHELQDRDLVQVDYIVRLMWELVGSIVSDKDALDGVEVDEAEILGQLSDMHL